MQPHADLRIGVEWQARCAEGTLRLDQDLGLPRFPRAEGCGTHHTRFVLEEECGPLIGPAGLHVTVAAGLDVHLGDQLRNHRRLVVETEHIVIARGGVTDVGGLVDERAFDQLPKERVFVAVVFDDERGPACHRTLEARSRRHRKRRAIVGRVDEEKVAICADGVAQRVGRLPGQGPRPGGGIDRNRGFDVRPFVFGRSGGQHSDLAPGQATVLGTRHKNVGVRLGQLAERIGGIPHGQEGRAVVGHRHVAVFPCVRGRVGRKRSGGGPGACAVGRTRNENVAVRTRAGHVGLGMPRGHHRGSIRGQHRVLIRFCAGVGGAAVVEQSRGRSGEGWHRDDRREDVAIGSVAAEVLTASPRRNKSRTGPDHGGSLTVANPSARLKPTQRLLR